MAHACPLISSVQSHERDEMELRAHVTVRFLLRGRVYMDVYRGKCKLEKLTESMGNRVWFLDPIPG